jgi:hypothetical protein
METVKTRSRRNPKAGPIVNDATDSTKKVDYTESPLVEVTTKKRKKKTAATANNNNKQTTIVTAAEIPPPPPPPAAQGILHDVEESAPVTKKAKKTVTIQEPEKDEDACRSPQESNSSKKSRKGRKKPHVQTPAKLNHIVSHKTITSATTSGASSLSSPHDSNNEDENKSSTTKKTKKRSRKAATAAAAKKQAEAALYYNLMNKSQTRISVSKSFHDAQNNQEEAANTNDNDVVPGGPQPPVFDLEALGEPNNEVVLGLVEGEEHVVETCAPGLNETITKDTNEKQQPVVVVVEEVQQQPKRTGGARIVRPKETISVVKNIVANNNELIEQHVEKKVVEIG